MPGSCSTPTLGTLLGLWVGLGCEVQGVRVWGSGFRGLEFNLRLRVGGLRS